MNTYRELRNNPATMYRMLDIDGLRIQLRNPIDEEHRQRILLLIQKKEAEIDEILGYPPS